MGLAGFAGTLVRYGCVRLVNHYFPGFPWGTLAVNMTGAFIAGFCFIFCRSRFLQYEAYFPVLFIGFPGAFTTFGTYTLESIRFFLMHNMENLPPIFFCKTSPDFLPQEAACYLQNCFSGHRNRNTLLLMSFRY